MKQIRQTAGQLIFDAVKNTFGFDGYDSGFYTDLLEYPPDPGMGDVAFPCFKLSRELRNSPQNIASALAGAIGSDSFEKVVQAGPYVNFFISDKSYRRILGEVGDRGEAYGSSDAGKGKTIVLDYSSPNISKPFHIGHLGTTVIGHSIKLIYSFLGYDCVGINYLGDWGTQNGKQIVAYKKWGDREKIEKEGIDALVELYVKFHEEAEKNPSLNDEARHEFKKLEEHDPENTELWKWFIDISFREYEKTYKQLGIEFDSYKGESFYSDKMPAQIEKLREKGLLKIDDGASIVDLSEYNMPPCLILKRDGSTLYPTRDIAAAVYRKEMYDFDKCIYVTSSAQSLHFAQWFKVVELMGYDWYDRLVHVPYGTISLNGEKLATRSGNVVLLRDLFAQSISKVLGIMDEKNPDLPDKQTAAEQIGVGAVIFYYLFNNRIKDISFDLNAALSFEGNTGPYAQYTYARTCSILDKAGAEAASLRAMPVSEEIAFEPAERDVIKTLSMFSEKVCEAAETYEPSVITRYIIDICTSFNRFYQSCPIINTEDEKVRANRLKLTAAVGDVLSSALHLICIKTPRKI